MRRHVFLTILLMAFVVVSVLTLAAEPARADINIQLPNGYQIEAVVTGLTFPTSVSWDSDGRMYITEAGYAYGAKEVGPGRVLRIDPDKYEVVLDGLNSPATNVKFDGDDMYVAHRSSLSVLRDGARQDLIHGLPSGDHYTGEIAVNVEEDWVYVGNGTTTNSGVVGDDNFRFGWVSDHPDWRDIPAKAVTLTGVNLSALDLRTANPTDQAETGAFVPFGTPTKEGQTIPGQTKASGVILRTRPDGTETEVYAWGLRNPFGLGFDPNGRLLAVDQGYDDRGVRPVANAPDIIYEIEQDAWYGWPDFCGGIPLDDPQFQSTLPGWPPKPLLSDPPNPEEPLILLQPHTVAMRFDFAPLGFDTTGAMYLAAFGSADPTTGLTAKETGSNVLKIDLDTGESSVFLQNKTGKPVGRNLTGLNHPVDVKFGPDDCMYIVDFGVFETNGQAPNAVPNTGVVWKVCKQRYGFRETGYAGNLQHGDNPWDPDYEPLKARLQEYLNGLGTRAEWGVFFKDLTSQNTFGIQEDLLVPAASTVKVPVVLFAATLASEGHLSWNEQLTYRAERDWRGGAGSLQFTAKDGDIFTIRELAEKSITESDNVAWKMLERRLGLENIAAFMREIGGTNVYPDWQNVSTARDMVTYMQATLDFAEKSPENGQDILHWLSNTIWNTGLNRFITEVEVGHKEGDITGVSDDMGIVYANHPYLIAIMSKGQDDVELGFEHIGHLSRIVYDYQVEMEVQAGKEPSP